jgi:hypothetical protein
MTSATTSAPGSLELFNLPVMNLRVIAMASLRQLKITSGAVEKVRIFREEL